MSRETPSSDGIDFLFYQNATIDHQTHKVPMRACHTIQSLGALIGPTASEHSTMHFDSNLCRALWPLNPAACSKGHRAHDPGPGEERPRAIPMEGRLLALCYTE
jgi:hypothetical protein